MALRFRSRDVDFEYSAKLVRISTEQVEALDKYRRKGQKTAIVEQAHLNNYGQAIVGSVRGARGGRQKVRNNAMRLAACGSSFVASLNWSSPVDSSGQRFGTTLTD